MWNRSNRRLFIYCLVIIVTRGINLIGDCREDRSRNRSSIDIIRRCSNNNNTRVNRIISRKVTSKRCNILFLSFGSIPFIPIGYLSSSCFTSSFKESRFRSEEHTSELQSRPHLVCRLLLEKKKNNNN